MRSRKERKLNLKQLKKKAKKKPKKRSISGIQTQEPVVSYHNPILEKRGPGKFYAKDEPLPEKYYKQRIPCPKCRCVSMPTDGGQAVKCMRSGKDVAYFECKNCHYRFSMPVSERR